MLHNVFPFLLFAQCEGCIYSPAVQPETVKPSGQVHIFIPQILPHFTTEFKDSGYDNGTRTWDPRLQIISRPFEGLPLLF